MIRALQPFETDENLARDEEAGFGALRGERGCLPLRSLDVRTKISGLHAHTVVRQTFHNAFAEAIEATYIFPLPDRAAVTSFTLRVADRVVEGMLRERKEARQEYDQAIAAGHRAAITEEERSGTFSLRVGNLPPGEDISVELTLVGPLSVAHGEAEFRFPLVVAPRYIPGMPLDGRSVGLGVEPDTDQAPDASRITPPVLLPGFPNPVRLSLEVEFEAASLATTPDILSRSLRSSLHGVIVDDTAGLTVRLQPAERLNRDFILRFAVAREGVETLLLARPAEAARAGTFALTIVPPEAPTDKSPQPRDVVFVLDRSGSMDGWKMVAARRAVGRLLDTLLEHDRFTVLAFDQAMEFSPATGRQLVAAGNRQRWRTIEWLAKVDARGGTEMGPALTAAARLLSGGDATREPILILITDGQVGGEDALLKDLARAIQGRPPRIFAVGIDQAVNAGFLRRLTDFGHGACELVESEDRLDEVMDHWHRLTSSPVLHDVRLEPLGWQCQEGSLAPARVADVFVDRPVTVLGRHAASGELRLRLRAIDASGRSWQQEVCAIATTSELLTSLWGRARVRDLEDRYASRRPGEGEELPEQIVAVSLESQVLSRFTAYVAVDRSEVVGSGGQPREIVQPVELPAGWDEPDLICGAGGMPHDAACSVVAMAPPLPNAWFTSFSKGAASPPRASRKSSSSPPPATLAEALEQTAAAVDAFQSLGWFSTRRRRLEALIERLEALETMMRGERHPRLSEVSDLIQSGRDMLVAPRLSEMRKLRRIDVQAFVEKVKVLVDELRQSPELVRTDFWK